MSARLATGGRIDRTPPAALHASTAAPDAASPATRWPPRCSPTASTWSAAASSTTGRAASSPPDPRNRTRWSRSTAAAGRREPNTRATMVPLVDGLVARSQNRWPSLRFDVGALAGSPRRCCRRASTTRPSSARAGGLAPALGAADPPHGRARPRARCARPGPLRQPLRPCDVLVVGAGPAGLAAALAAAEARRTRHPLRRAGRDRAAACWPIRAASTAQPAWTGWPTRCAACAPTRASRCCSRDHGLPLRRCRTSSPWRRCWTGPTGCASGCGRCAPSASCWPPAPSSGRIPFAGNDRPGVMLADAARTYAHRYGVLPGRRVVAGAAHDSG